MTNYPMLTITSTPEWFLISRETEDGVKEVLRLNEQEARAVIAGLELGLEARERRGNSTAVYNNY